eukprot:1140465-Pelagomonas_calceolata.AAC.7
MLGDGKGRAGSVLGVDGVGSTENALKRAGGGQSHVVGGREGECSEHLARKAEKIFGLLRWELPTNAAPASKRL